MTLVTRQSIVEDLRALGLAAGDVVLLHSSLSSLGRVDGGAATVVQAFLDVLGGGGTLVVPTFGRLGVVTDTLKAWPGAVSSVHPFASVAAVGAQAAAICRDHWKAELAHGPDTPYCRIADLGGYVCLLGVDQDRNTTLHTAEELLRLPYLKTTPAALFETPEGPQTRSWPFFPGPHRDFIGLDALLQASGKMKVGRVGRAVTRLMRSKDLINVCLAAGRADPAFVLCSNPNCHDCVSQRADLRRARLARESFRLAAAASLAGRSVPQIVEQCRRVGIDAIELDEIDGRPVESAEPADVRRAVDGLREAGLTLAAIRARSVRADMERLLDTARDAGVARVVLPLSHRSGQHAGLARDRGLAASFFNTCMDGATASELVLAAQPSASVSAATSGGDAPAAGFTFSAAGFARAGELPFLRTYKQKLRRYVDQLDLEDCLYDGTPQPLAMGNAEVKEMVSVLRCASFAGWMVLGAGNRSTGDLADAATRFVQLLDRM